MENQASYIPQEESIDFKKILGRLLHNWYWFVISLAITYTSAHYITYYSEPKYSVSATLIVSDEKKTTAELLINALDRYSNHRNLENEITILQSYKLAYRTISELPDFAVSYFWLGRVRTTLMYQSSPFKLVLDTTGRKNGALVNTKVNVTILSNKEYRLEIGGLYKISLNQKFGVPVVNDLFNFTIVLNNPSTFVLGDANKYFFVVNDMNNLVNTYRGKLSIATNDKKGTVLTLATVGIDPQMEADYLNKLMDVYIQNGLEEKNQTAINTIKFIDGQLSTVVDSLHRTEDKLQKYRLSNRILDISSEGAAIMSRLEKVQEEKVQLELQLKYYNYLQSYIENKKDFREAMAPSVMGIADPLLNSLVVGLATLYGERAIMLLNAQENYPGLTLLNAKIQNGLIALKENVRQIINSTKVAMADVDAREAKVELEIQQLPVTERGLLTIQRDYKLNDQTYDFLVQRRADAAIAKASNVADNKVLDAATAQNSIQISPKKSQNMMMAIVLGLFIPLAVFVILEFLDNNITDPKDIEKATMIPVLGSVGHNEIVSDIPVAENPRSAIAESFRALRTNLQYVMRENDQKVVCISSTISGEGKTFCAVNLAAIVAQSNKRVLLMSLDLRRPKIHLIFNVDNEKGLSSYLIGRTTYENTITKTNINNLFVATAGPVPPNPAELLETPKMKEFIDQAKLDFDFIVMDTPPLAIVTDAVLLSRFSDAFIFVVRQNYSKKEFLQLVNDFNEKRSVDHLGILINDIKINSYYGYRYSYGYGYRYYGHTYSEYYGEDAVKKSFFKRLKDRFLS